MAHHLGTSQSSQNLRASYAFHPHRLPVSASSASLLLPHSASFQSFGDGSRARSSGTWTTSSGELGLLNNADAVEDRDVFVQEYNRLAKKHGVRQLVTEDFEARHQGEVEKCLEKRGWFSRLLRSTPNRIPHASAMSPPPQPQPQPQPQPPPIRHKRSVSDFANIIHCRREPPRVIEIQEMVRLGGKSILYLPQDYSPCSLVLPTCIRATAQYLAQNVATRGLFRVPGSAKVISALFDYYCYMDHSNAKIASTVRCATLPIHIQYSTHDVASTFKRLLSVIPGGVLGSLALFDAFVAIHSQLNGEPEYPRTKQTKVRARLIALAIGTVTSQYRRELICAVFGLLSLIGRAAEIAPREDEDSRPLPTADLMGYSALGIVFGPLLVGDLLEQYTMKVATPTSGMMLFPLSPTRFRKERRKSMHMDSKAGGPPTVDRILVANDLTKMLISNWRDVVRQMRSLGTHCRRDASTIDLPGKQGTSQPAQGFNIKAPKESDDECHDGRPTSSQAPRPHHESETPTHGPRSRRLKVLRRANSQRLLSKKSMATLSPTKEESLGDDESSDRQGRREGVLDRLQKLEKKKKSRQGPGEPDEPADNPNAAASQVYLESVPPRESSRHASSHDDSRDSLSKRVASAQTTLTALHLTQRESTATLEAQAHQRNMDEKLSSPDQAKVMAGARKRSEESSSLAEGGIRLVQTSPAPAADVRGLESDHGQACVEPSTAAKPAEPFVSHDQGIQCQILTEQERRRSIDSTPERFYPFPLLPRAAQPVTPERSMVGKRLGAKKRQKQPMLLHGPRLSKSDENLRSQASITLQSPTESRQSQELTKKGSVRAMAALFELQPGWRESAASTESRARSPRRSRHSKSDSAWTQRQDPLADLVQDGKRISEGHQGLSSDHNVSRVMKLGDDGKSEEEGPKPVPSLGTMVPCPEQPPIAQHLNMARPASSPSRMAGGEPGPGAEKMSTPPVSRAGSATLLYSQIRKLQRQLDAKTEEAAQLRRQLEAQKDSDVGTVSEQLRQAKRDVAAWKDRAETAERRVKVFEKFSEKLKEIRDAVEVAKPRMPGMKESSLTAGPADAKGGTGGHAVKVVEAVRMMQEAHGLATSQDGADSQGSGSVTGEGQGSGGGGDDGQIWAVLGEFWGMEEARVAKGTDWVG
ncbi:hypothetical protein E4U41_007600 [Claviceps citrina]|nr:hypothetical protein E4U41_007600 [Claviceps citrina]